MSKRESIKNNVFITGIPNSTPVDGEETEVNSDIVQSLFEQLVPSITTDNYKIIKSFESREGYTRHSCLIAFHKNDTKKSLLEQCKKLKDRDETDPFRRVYIKHEQPPMTHKENNRHHEFKKNLRN